MGPWAQVGWGYVDGATPAAMVELLRGRAEAPDKADAAAFLEPLYEVRTALWAARQG